MDKKILVVDDEADTRKLVKAVLSAEGFTVSEADSVILLYNVRKGAVRQRVAEILKMRGTDFESKIFPVKISAEKGLVFYPEESIF